MLRNVLIGALGALGYITASYAFDIATDDDKAPFSPGHPYGQVVEQPDPCGGKK